MNTLLAKVTVIAGVFFPQLKAYSEMFYLNLVMHNMFYSCI